MKHLHHIIPKHVGGTDHPSNLIELSIEEHAEAHRKLYDQYGRKQDKLAWMGLSKMIGGKEIIIELLKAPKSEEHKRKISKAHKGMIKLWLFGNKHAIALKGRKKTIAHQEAINRALNNVEVKQKISASWNNKTIVKCPHCNLEGKEGHNMKRYHFNNCKRNFKND